MRERAPYTKPAVLRLDYSVDAAVVSFTSCKSSANNDGRVSSEPGATGSCNATSCSSVTDT